MRWPRFWTTLHFRIPALFLALLGLSAGAYYLWVNATVLQPSTEPGEDEWYDRVAAVELDSLAHLVGCDLADVPRAEEHLVRFGERSAVFQTEVVITDLAGTVIASSRPDSLTAAVAAVDPLLLTEMTRPDWDWNSYPVPEDIDAYPNRIFEVDRLFADTDTNAAPIGFLVASFQPITIDYNELIADYRRLRLQALAIALASAALSGLIIMGWLSRRIRQLSAGVDAFAAGDLARRVPATSRDELGNLGRCFNDMGVRLQASMEELQQKERFQRRLIANISHDLRTPMTSLRGYIDTLLINRDQLPAQERNRYLNIISANLDHLDKLIDQLLDLSRLDAGQAKFQPEDFPLPELVDEALSRCAVAASERDVTLRVELAAELPLVHADPLQTAQVLQNLIDNGIKFNVPGGEVVVRLACAGDAIAVSISDTGVGIPSEDLPHVFERFFTSDRSRTRKGNSSGLGLAISQKILAGHGTELTVQSEFGAGATFGFQLPAVDTPRAQSAEA